MADSTVYILGGADSESFSVKRKTGWIPLTDMSTNTTVRRFNARYKSSETVSAKIYSNGDGSTVLWSGSLPENMVVEDPPVVKDKYDSIKVGRRANSIMVEVYTSASTSTDLEIGKIEVEVDGK
ncbi:MAG TPA: hypothetical protein EYF95_08145 [Flavobacteriales bacterium]|nr:hypothetical protein [Flavobacteriales bacterium]HIK67927.1 hypothetical protein [Flavobacteriales bacterium]